MFEARSTSEYFGGIEGGASNTKFALVRSDGKVMSTSEGDGTNQYLIGVPECLRRIEALVKDALKKAGLPSDTVLEGLGMSLSGGDEKAVQEKIISAVEQQYPTLTRHTFVGSDTQSALATALPQGGVVIIAGTGSNCQLVNSDGTMFRSGGWGHMIGDEGSACWISLRAMKIMFDHEDNFEESNFSIDTVKHVILNYFKVEHKAHLIDHLYAHFDKAKFSGLCKDLAKAAFEEEDPLCRHIFKEAGQQIAQHLCAVANRANLDLKTQEGGLPVVCMGSVFKSWKLLEPGFVEVMRSRSSETGVKELTLLSLTGDATLGASALGARAANKTLPLDYSNNSTLLFSTKL